MRSLLAASGSMLCVLMAACALDNAPENADDPATTSVDSSEIETIPPELSFEALDGTAAGDNSLDGYKSCHVSLLSCYDPHYHPPVATFCKKGHCDDKEAYKQAYKLCKEYCRESACKRIYFRDKC
jgi:hypothetical protein